MFGRSKKSAHFRCNYLFWENGPFFGAHSKVTKHYKNRGFSRHGGKPKMALLVAKVPFWVFLRKGVLLSVIHKSCALLKTLFYSVFSKHSFVDMKECNLKKKLPKIGVVCQCKKVFWGYVFFAFWWSCFFVACVFVLVFC